MKKKSPLVQVKKITKSYKMNHGEVDALKEIDFEVYEGELLAIMGPSGSGKSTLLHLLGCLDRPTTGQYLLDQQDISCLSDYELAAIRASKIGFVFQSFNLIPQLTVFENVEIPFLYQTFPENIFQKVTESLEKVGLSHRLHHRPSQLSGGEMQRVAIARALAINPLIILADEPTGNLDSATGESILELFHQLHALGATILMITHDPLVANHCERILTMRDGCLIRDERR